MLKLIARRLLLSIITLWIVSVIVFGATELLPGDVATALLGREATPETLARLRTELGLDRPAGQRYVEWLSSALRGDLGMSLAKRNTPVIQLIMERMRNTLLLSGLAAL
ncbi:MAG: ABC transporter permease, partial [Chloroflexi bacterium]